MKIKNLKITLIFVVIFITQISYSQSYKNIKTYNSENTKIAHFFVYGLDGNTEKAIVFSKILYSYPDIYFVYVATNGTGIAFLSKSSLLEKEAEEIQKKYKYSINAVNYSEYSNEIFLDYYLEESYSIRIKEGKKPFDMVKLGISDKDILNYTIAKEIYKDQMGN